MATYPADSCRHHLSVHQSTQEQAVNASTNAELESGRKMRRKKAEDDTERSKKLRPGDLKAEDSCNEVDQKEALESHSAPAQPEKVISSEAKAHIDHILARVKEHN